MMYVSVASLCILLTSNISTVFSAMEPSKSKLCNMIFAVDFCQSSGGPLMEYYVRGKS